MEVYDDFSFGERSLARIALSGSRRQISDVVESDRGFDNHVASTYSCQRDSTPGSSTVDIR